MRFIWKRLEYIVALLLAVPLSLDQKYSTSLTYSGWLNSKVSVPKLPDMWLFFKDGDLILAGHYDKVYQTSIDQVGPVQLVFDRLLIQIGNIISWPVLFWLMMAGALLAVGKFTQLLSYRMPKEEDLQDTALDIRAKKITREQWAAVVSMSLASLLGLPVLIVSWGHWWQVPVFFLWWFAIMSLSKGRPKAAGLASAVAMGLEPWGIIGVLPIALFTKSWKMRIIYFASSSAGLLFWLPFYLTKGFSFGKKTWAVFDTSLWGAWRVVGFSWTDRMIQGAIISLLACLMGFLVANRALPLAWRAWVLVTMLGLLRLGLDSIVFSYYWQGVATFFLVGTVAAWSRKMTERWGLPILFAITTIAWVPWRWAQHWNTWTEPFTFFGALFILLTLFLVVQGESTPNVSPKDTSTGTA